MVKKERKEEKDIKEDNDANIVVTMRCMDVVPYTDVDKRKCDDCGEMTWISSSFRDRKVDKVICSVCIEKYIEGYNDEDCDMLVTEKCLEDAINAVACRTGEMCTREDVLKAVENKVGRKIIVVK